MPGRKTNEERAAILREKIEKKEKEEKPEESED